MNEATRACIDCGADISQRHHNAKRCTTCASAAAKAQQGIGTRSEPCSVDDAECVPGRLKNGMCDLHNRRLKRTGTIASPRLPIFTRYTVTPAGCWEWVGGLFPNGYGKLSRKAHDTPLAHRAFYIEHVGPVPDGLDLDHLCRNRRCVNPAHLEPVTRSVNIQRGVDARATGYCKRGHDQSLPDARVTDGRGSSRCRECWRISYQAAYKRYRAKLAG